MIDPRTLVSTQDTQKKTVSKSRMIDPRTLVSKQTFTTNMPQAGASGINIANSIKQKNDVAVYKQPENKSLSTIKSPMQSLDNLKGGSSLDRTLADRKMKRNAGLNVQNAPLFTPVGLAEAGSSPIELVEAHRQAEKELSSINQAQKEAGNYEKYMGNEYSKLGEYQNRLGDSIRGTDINQMARAMVALKNAEAGKEIEDLSKYYDSGATQANYISGNLNIRYNEAMAKYLKTQNPADLNEAERIRELINLYNENAENIGEGGIIRKDFASYAPQLVGQTVSGVKGALAGAGAGALTGAGIGSIVPGAGTVAGASTGALWGARGGYVAGVGAFSYDQMQGSAYSQLLDLGIPDDVAREVASDTALWQSVVEMTGAVVDLASLGLGSKAIKGVAGKTVGQLTAKQLIINALKAYGINLVEETAEEAIQEKIAIEQEKKAFEKADLERTTTGKEDWKRIVEAGAGGFKIALVSGSGNVIGNITATAINSSTIDKVNRTYDEQINKIKTSNISEQQKQEQINNLENGRKKTVNAIKETMTKTEGNKIIKVNNLQENVAPQSLNAQVQQQTNEVIPQQTENQNNANVVQNNTQIAQNTPKNVQTSQNNVQNAQDLQKTGQLSTQIETKSNVSENISEDIDNILNNINERNPVKLRDYTPSILVQNGIKDLPMYENPSHIRNNILTESEAKKLGLKVTSKEHYHGLGKDTYIKAIDSLDDPRVVLKYKNVPNQYIILTVVKDSQGNNIIVPIQVETDTYVNKIKVDINRIKSVYGYDRTNPDLNKYIKDSIKNNNLEKIYEKKKPSTSKTSQSASINSILPQTQNYVNSQNIMPSEEQLKKYDSRQNKQAYESLNGRVEDDLKSAIDNISKNENANKVSYTTDWYRNMRNVFGDKAAKELTGIFDNQKLAHVKFKQKFANELKTYVVDKLGIKPGSKMSADVQRYGEKLITEAELKTKYPKDWQKIVEADKWFRTKYNELIDAINSTREDIYPNVEEQIKEAKESLLKTYDLIKEAEKTGIAPYKIDQDIQDNIKRLEERIESKKEKIKEIEDANRPNYRKTKKYNSLVEQLQQIEQNKNELEKTLGTRYDKKVTRLKKRAQRLSDTLNSEELWRGKRIPKRDNYYRHFQEMTEGFKALHNIFETPAEISSQLAGTSEYTKPNSKFLGLAQKRTTNKTEYDAVKGFLNYLEPASYAINIDPFTTELRAITKTIKENTADTKNANKLIEYLDDFANSLAGKTNPFDRLPQKLTNRKTMKAIEWMGNRIKSNAVLGNINSSISQILNLPQVVGKIKNPVRIAQGLYDLVTGNGKYQDSQFIQERYHSNIISQFNTKLLQQPKKFATWMLGALDEGVTKTGWNAVYRQAIKKGIENPVQYADDTMRDLVAGRGIGEKSLAQESKLVNLIMPFTVETGNYWRVMKDFVKEKDLGGILITYIVGWLLNRGIEALGASGKTFDPIDAIYDAITEEDITILERVGRVGGEILSSMPFGQQLAAIYPEYGADFGVFELPTREKLFGSNDPTRFGTGSMFTNIFEHPITSLAMPWGGTQLRRTVEGAKALLKGGDYKTNSKGEEQLKFPVSLEELDTTQKFLKAAQILTLGKYATPEADEYFENGALSALQTKGLKEANKLGVSAKKYYEIKQKIKDIEVPTRKNKEGKDEAIPGARKQLIIDELNKTDLNNEQKKLFYDIFYSKELKGD